MKDMIRKLNIRWAALSSRERNVLAGGGAAAAVILWYALLLDPALGAAGKLRRGIAQLRADAGWMTESAKEARELVRAREAALADPVDAAALIVARETGLPEGSLTVRLSGEDRVAFNIADVPVEKLFMFLERLKRDKVMVVNEIVITSAAPEGTSVAAEGTLQRLAVMEETNG